MFNAKHVSLGLVCCVTALLGCSEDKPGNVVDGPGSPSAGATVTDADAGRSGPATNPTGTGAKPASQTGATAGEMSSAPVPATPSGPLPEPVSVDQTGKDNPAGLAAEDVKKLMEGGPLGDLRWLYPYEGTVFPRGMLAPVVMWNGDPAADAVYLRIKSQRFEYKGVLKPTGVGELFPPSLGDLFGQDFLKTYYQGLTARGMQVTGKQLLIPQEIWDLAGRQTLGKEDSFTLELAELANGQARGSISSHIQIAQTDIKGSVYYTSCNSALEGSGNEDDTWLTQVVGGGSAKVFRIPPGGTAQLLLSKPGDRDGRCQGCHSVSADGSRLIAQRGPNAERGVLNPFSLLSTGLREGLSYQLRPGGIAEPLSGISVGPNAAYGALYPDGSKFLSTAIPSSVASETAATDPNVALYYFGFAYAYGVDYGSSLVQFPLTPATLYDATNGAVTPDTGIPTGAMMPTFSPDGKRLVFTDLDITSGPVRASGLAVMDYDTRNHKASGYKVLMQEQVVAGSSMRPGWPFFLPDNKAVIFVRTESPTFAANGPISPGTPQATFMNYAGANPATLPYHHSDLSIVDVASGKVTLLAKAMGFNTPEDAATDNTYFPFGTLDLHHSYFPTVAQVAAGGYFWVFFDSLRHYGNLGVQRQLWGFAIDIRRDGYALDPSHPPFYLPGQEFGTANNHRAFVALDPCELEGRACTSSIQCCAGTMCAIEEGKVNERGLPVGTCAPPPETTTCAKLDERCTSGSDCCDASNDCINGFCASIPLL